VESARTTSETTALIFYSLAAHVTGVAPPTNPNKTIVVEKYSRQQLEGDSNFSLKGGRQ
jgi:hypothetical protein